MNDTDLDSRLEAFRKEAVAECARLRCRNYGDCNPACRYFFATATEGEIEAAKRADEKYRKPSRGWEGAIASRRENVVDVIRTTCSRQS